MILQILLDFVSLNTTPLSLRQRWIIWRAYVWLLVSKKIIPESNEETRSVSFFGGKLRYYTLSNFIGIVREVFVRGDYYFKSKDVRPLIIDCGANIGLASLYFSFLYPDARIIAIEPGREAFGRLSENVRTHRMLTNVTCHNVAASDHAGREDFYENRRSAGGSTLNATIAGSKGVDIFEKMSVETIKLSSLITEEVSLLKMDVEGGELTIFKELETSGKLQLIKEIVFECHYNKSSAGNSVPDIISLLERNGFLPVISGEVSKSRFKKTPIYHFMVHAYRG